MRTKRDYFHIIFLLTCLAILPCISFAQQKEVLKSVDSVNTVTTITDTSADGKKKTKVRVYNPGKAAMRSAIIPGWGQVYNRKYWKVPIIYGALGVTAVIFVNNLHTYEDLKFSYAAKYKASLPPYDSTKPYLGPYQDSTDYKKMK